MKDPRFLFALAALESDAGSDYQYQGDTVKLLGTDAMPALETMTSMGFKTEDKSVATSFKLDMSLKNDYNFNGSGKLFQASYDTCLKLDTPQTVGGKDYGYMCYLA